MKVKIEKCVTAEWGETEPQFATLPPQLNDVGRPDVLRFGEELKDEGVRKSIEEYVEFVGQGGEVDDE